MVYCTWVLLFIVNVICLKRLYKLKLKVNQPNIFFFDPYLVETLLHVNMWQLKTNIVLQSNHLQYFVISAVL